MICVRHPEIWPAFSVLDIEWKRNEKAKRRTKQIELAEAGWSVIVDSQRDLAEAIHRFELADSRIRVHPAVEEWLAAHPSREAA